MNRSLSLSSHVLNLDNGRPVSGLAVTLADDDGRVISSNSTDDDGRIRAWPPGEELSTGIYTLTFATGDWFQDRNSSCFYPTVTVRFALTEEQPHYHVPLLLNRFGYSTYRGS